MNISIMNIRPATADEWDAIWQQCDYATYFQSREWADIWKIYTKGKMRPEPKLVLFSDGKKALLPLSSQKVIRKLTKQYFSSPAGTFGGWISSDKLNKEHSNLLIGCLFNRFNNLVWRINPYNEKEFVPEAVKIGIKNEETYALDLKVGFKTIYQQWIKEKKSLVRKVKKALREGVSIETASTLNDWQDYYQVYEESLKRWGEKASFKYEWKLFNDIYQLNSPHVNLWLAIYQEKIIAGSLCFYSKQHVVYWHGAALSQYFHVRPVNLLMCEIIKHACEGEYSWFDFNPSGGHEGVTTFKKSFGAKSLPCPIVSTQDSFTTFLRVVKSKFEQRKDF